MTKKITESEDSGSFYIEAELEEVTHDPDFVPIKKLLSAVLERAMLDLSATGEIRQSALEWFSQEQVEDAEMMTFQLICEVLNLDFLKLQSKILDKAGQVKPSDQKELTGT